MSEYSEDGDVVDMYGEPLATYPDLGAQTHPLDPLYVDPAKSPAQQDLHPEHPVDPLYVTPNPPGLQTPAPMPQLVPDDEPGVTPLMIAAGLGAAALAGWLLLRKRR